MKKRILQASFGFVIVISILTAFKNYDKGQPSENSFSFLRKNFNNPDKAYGTAPLWVWNTMVTKAEIDAMLLDFKKKEFGGVFIHPRPGLITEYLSKEWFDLTKYAVQKGKELGLNVWLYDENSYPSGFAGGHVPDQMPESYNQGIILSMTKASVLPDTALAFYRVLKKEGDHFKNITKNLKDELGKSGDYYLFSKKIRSATEWTAGFPYVDLMVKGVTEKFLDVTVSGYKKAFGEEFGKTVPGIFCDESTIQVEGAGNFRWTPDLFSTFKESWNYDLEDNLPSLFEEVGNWQQVRHNYYHTLLKLYIDRWSKPYSSYAEKNGLIWTGHYYEHSWPSPYHTPDNMAMYAWHQMPGIDMLFNEYNEIGMGPLRQAQIGNLRAVRELASVANQLNKKRTLSETYAGSGWEVSFNDLKRQADWQLAMGVNFICQHLSDMSIHGSRKYDYPQSFSYHNPWFEYYGEQNKYIARLSMVLSQGEQVNDVLVLEPTTSGWMYAIFGKSHPAMNNLGYRFVNFVTKLEKEHVEYDLGSENIIMTHGKVDGKKFIVGDRAYTTVVIPAGMENIDSPTLTLLEQYLANGGKVLQFEQVQKLNGANHPRIAALNNHKNLTSVNNLSDEAIAKYFLNRDVTISTQRRSAGGNVYHNRRLMDDGQVIFLANVDVENYANGEINLKSGDALLMDAFTGKISDYPETTVGSGKSVKFRIPPAGSMLLFIADQKQTGFEKYTVPRAQKYLQSTSALKINRPKENSLMIDFCDVKVGNSVIKDQFIYNASDTVYKYHGFKKGNPWTTAVQFKTKILDRNTFQKGTGFTATYNFNVAEGVNAAAFRAVIEQAGLYSNISINGNTVVPAQGKWWLDRSFNTIDIGKFVKTGANSLSITADPMHVLAEIQPVYILGNFDVVPASKGWSIAPPSPLKLGSWKEQGMPLYGYGVTYSKDYTISNLGASHFVQLGDWKGTVAAVKVNGKDAGTIAYAPYSLDVSKFLRKGKNTIEVEVVGSLKNLLGPHHSNPPTGYVSPGLFRKVKGYPGGNNYSTIDYGLMHDFKLAESIR